MDDGNLISKATAIKKPKNPRTGNISVTDSIWKRLESKITTFHVLKHEELVNNAVEYVCNETQLEDIPTAVLRLGSNVSDHSQIFDALCERITCVTRLISRLKPVDCTSLTTIVDKLFQDFINCLELDDPPKLKRSSISLENLVQMYKLVTKDPIEDSPSKRRKQSTTIPKLGPQKFVIIIEDVSSVKLQVLEDFCLILKNHLEVMDVSLVFGISSTSMSLHKTLTQKTAACLSVKTFMSPLVTETLAGIFELLVLNKDFPFKLSPEVFQWLTDFVLYHDFSLATLLHILKVCLQLHLKAMDADVIKQISSGDIKDEGLKAAMSIHEKNQNERNILANCISMLADNRAVRFRDVYLTLQMENPLNSDVIKKYEQTVKVLSTPELSARMEKIILEQENDTSILDKFIELCEKLNEENIEEAISDGTTDLTAVKSRFELKAKLMQAAQNKRTTKLDLVRDELISFMRKMIENLSLPKDLPHYTDVFMGNLSTLKTMFMPSVRSKIHTALSTPAAYLKCKCCEVKANELSNNLPPISIAYKLHLECGKMINMYDWLLSYQSVKEDESKVAIAQFLRSVRELQVLGYVKPTPRKTDHVQRLTWGSC